MKKMENLHERVGPRDYPWPICEGCRYYDPGVPCSRRWGCATSLDELEKNAGPQPREEEE